MGNGENLKWEVCTQRDFIRRPTQSSDGRDVLIQAQIPIQGWAYEGRGIFSSPVLGCIEATCWEKILTSGLTIFHIPFPILIFLFYPFCVLHFQGSGEQTRVKTGAHNCAKVSENQKKSTKINWKDYENLMEVGEKSLLWEALYQIHPATRPRQLYSAERGNASGSMGFVRWTHKVEFYFLFFRRDVLNGELRKDQALSNAWPLNELSSEHDILEKEKTALPKIL